MTEIPRAAEPYLYDRMPLSDWSIWTNALVSKLPMNPFKTGMVADMSAYAVSTSCQINGSVMPMLVSLWEESVVVYVVRKAMMRRALLTHSQWSRCPAQGKVL